MAERLGLLEYFSKEMTWRDTEVKRMILEETYQETGMTHYYNQSSHFLFVTVCGRLLVKCCPDLFFALKTKGGEKTRQGFLS